MKTFSVEGSSPTSMEEAMANAMANAAAAAGGVKHMDIAISGVVKNDDGSFRVTVHVIANEEDEDLTEEDDGGEGEGRQNAREKKRAEEVSQHLKEEMDRQFYVHAHHMSMDEGLDEGKHAKEVIEDSHHFAEEPIEESSPDTLAYTQANHPDSTFDIVGEVNEPAGPDARTGGNYINVASHEVDEVIGLLSLGFYEPTKPEVPEAPRDEVERETPEPGRRAAPRHNSDEPVPELS